MKGKNKKVINLTVERIKRRQKEVMPTEMFKALNEVFPQKQRNKQR
jgi:hypothetical protein